MKYELTLNIKDIPSDFKIQSYELIEASTLEELLFRFTIVLLRKQRELYEKNNEVIHDDIPF